MISYKTYKILNESLGSMTLGIGQRPSLGIKSPNGFNSPVMDDEQIDDEEGLDSPEDEMSDELGDESMGDEMSDELGDESMGEEPPMGEEPDSLPFSDKENDEIAKLAGLEDPDQMDYDDEMGDEMGDEMSDEFGMEDEGLEDDEEEEEVDEMGNPIPKAKPPMTPMPMEMCNVDEKEKDCKKKKKDCKNESDAFFQTFLNNARGTVHKKLAEDAVVPPSDPNVGLADIQPNPGDVGFAPQTRFGVGSETDIENHNGAEQFFGYTSIPSFNEFYERKKAEKEQELND